MVSPQTIKSADLLSTSDLLAEADASWHAKRYGAAELYYAAALDRTDLTKEAKPSVYFRLADSAYRNGHYQQARLALEGWANTDTTVLERKDWEQLYLGSMAALDKTERLQNHLKWVLESKTVPWATKQEVALWFTKYFQERQDYERALGVLDGFYKQAPDDQAKIAFEQAYQAQVTGFEDDQLESLLQAVTTTNEWRFPYALVVFEHGARQAPDKEAWSTAWRSLRNIATDSTLVDRVPLEDKLAELEAKYGMPRIGIAMLLPVTGPYGKVGVKILRGAGLAQWRLAQDGVDVDMRVINTEADGWEAQLAALPAHYTVVGGPLRIDAFKRLYAEDSPANGQLSKRAVFSFLSTLGGLTEGKDAWRFFTGRNDEVRSLVSMAVDKLGIKDLAVFYPEEKFGRAMAQTFYQEATQLGGRIKGMQGYPSHDLKPWSKRVGKLLNVPRDFSNNKDVPLPMPDFGAVFIPDGWNKAEALLPNFFFYEGEQLVFLGPGLWSRALDSHRDIDEHYFRLAICPGAWWDDSDGGKALQSALTEEGLGQADFWVALGYDFIRFGGKLGVLPSSWDSAVVNKRIRGAEDMEFSMAPIVWNADGVASQKLYLFTPVQNGKKIADPASISGKVARATARREKRMEAYKQRMKNTAANKK